MRLPGDFTFHKTGDPWFSWTYVTSHGHDILTATQQHVPLPAASIALGAAASVPLAAIARRNRWLREFILGLCNAVYAIPSLAFVVAMFKIFDLSKLTVIIPLAAYAQVILVRNI